MSLHSERELKIYIDAQKRKSVQKVVIVFLHSISQERLNFTFCSSLFGSPGNVLSNKLSPATAALP